MPGAPQASDLPPPSLLCRDPSALPKRRLAGVAAAARCLRFHQRDTALLTRKDKVDLQTLLISTFGPSRRSAGWSRGMPYVPLLSACSVRSRSQAAAPKQPLPVSASAHRPLHIGGSAWDSSHDTGTASSKSTAIFEASTTKSPPLAVDAMPATQLGRGGCSAGAKHGRARCAQRSASARPSSSTQSPELPDGSLSAQRLRRILYGVALSASVRPCLALSPGPGRHSWTESIGKP